MIESVVADVGPATSMVVATISASSEIPTATIAATAAAAAVAAPCLAEAVWKCEEFRIRKAVPSLPSPLTAKTAKILSTLRGGGSTAVVKKAPGGGKVDNSLATRGKAVAFMALAMACHYLGK